MANYFKTETEPFGMTAFTFKMEDVWFCWWGASEALICTRHTGNSTTELETFPLGLPISPSSYFFPFGSHFLPLYCLKTQWPYEMTLCFTSRFLLSSWSPLYLPLLISSYTLTRHRHRLNETHRCTLVWPLKGKQSPHWPVKPGLPGECLGNALELWLYQSLSGTSGLCVCLCSLHSNTQTIIIAYGFLLENL